MLAKGDYKRMPHLSPWEIGIVLSLVPIIFGVGKLPQVGGAFGKGIREFRRAKLGMVDDDQSAEEPDKGKGNIDWRKISVI